MLLITFSSSPLSRGSNSYCPANEYIITDSVAALISSPVRGIECQRSRAILRIAQIVFVVFDYHRNLLHYQP
jgi:hypothetical protein